VVRSLSRRPGVTTRTRVVEYADGQALRRDDRLVTEEPLEVRLTWPGAEPRRVAVTMRTPGHDFELAVGLLFAEGVFSAGQVHRVAYCTDADLTAEQQFNVVTVDLDVPPRRVPERTSGVTGMASACGVCGTDSIHDVLALCEVRQSPEPVLIAPEVILAAPERLRAAQAAFERTGAIHAAGLFTADGEPLVVREDVGRHNAVDKVIGARLLAGEPTQVPLLVVSGRAGFEIVQKAAAAGVAAIAAIGAPSGLAARLAEDAGVALAGFVSARRFVVYAGEDRLGVG
jgi:FdhD protein